MALVSHSWPYLVKLGQNIPIKPKTHESAPNCIKGTTFSPGEPGRTGQNRGEPGSTGQYRAVPGSTGQCLKTGLKPIILGPKIIEQILKFNKVPGNTGQYRAVPGNTGHWPKAGPRDWNWLEVTEKSVLSPIINLYRKCRPLGLL